MKKSRSSEPRSPLLFQELDVTHALEHRETIATPPNDSLELILEDLRKSPICGACRGRMPLVFGTGNPQASLMLISEGPGVDDIESRLPFQGQAGMLVNKMMAAIRVPPTECYLTNVIKCIPPAARNFSLEEIEDCRPFLIRQVLVVKPEIILAFGALAAQTLFNSQATISALRGRVYKLVLNDHEIAVVPTFNPGYILRAADKKREAWEDLKLVRDLLTN